MIKSSINNISQDNCNNVSQNNMIAENSENNDNLNSLMIIMGNNEINDENLISSSLNDCNDINSLVKETKKINKNNISNVGRSVKINYVNQVINKHSMHTKKYCKYTKKYYCKYCKKFINKYCKKFINKYGKRNCKNYTKRIFKNYCNKSNNKRIRKKDKNPNFRLIDYCNYKHDGNIYHKHCCKQMKLINNEVESLNLNNDHEFNEDKSSNLECVYEFNEDQSSYLNNDYEFNEDMSSYFNNDYEFNEDKSSYLNNDYEFNEDKSSYLNNDYELQCDHNNNEKFVNVYYQYYAFIEYDSSSSEDEMEHEYEGEGGEHDIYEHHEDISEEETFEEETEESVADVSDEYLPTLYKDEYIYEDEAEEAAKIRIKYNVNEMSAEMRINLIWDLLDDSDKRILNAIMREEEAGGDEDDLDMKIAQPIRQITLLKNIKRCKIILDDLLYEIFNLLEPKMYVAEALCELDVRLRQEFLSRKLKERRERARKQNIADVKGLLTGVISSIPGLKSEDDLIHRMRYWSKKYAKDIIYAEKHKGVTFWKYWNESDRVKKPVCKPKPIKKYEAQKEINYKFNSNFKCDLKRELKPLNVNKVPITKKKKFEILEQLIKELHLYAIHIMNVVAHHLKEPIDEGNYPDIVYYDLLIKQIIDKVTPEMYTSGSDTASDYENYPDAETYRLVNRRKRRCLGINRTKEFSQRHRTFPMVILRNIMKMLDDINALHHKRLLYRREKRIMEKLKPNVPYKNDSIESFDYKEPGFFNDIIRRNERKLAKSVWPERKHLAPANIRTIYKRNRLNYTTLDKLPVYSDTSSNDDTFCGESIKSTNLVHEFIDKSRYKEENPSLQVIFEAERDRKDS